jgi:hypothetical protein
MFIRTRRRFIKEQQKVWLSCQLDTYRKTFALFDVESCAAEYQ